MSKYIKEMPLTGDLTSGVSETRGRRVFSWITNINFRCKDLEPDWNHFEELVWPALAKRVPIFEELKLTGAGWLL